MLSESSLGDRWSRYAEQYQEKRVAPVAPSAARKAAPAPPLCKPSTKPSPAMARHRRRLLRTAPGLPLTKRETQVVKRLSEGATISEIAGELSRSEKVVEYHSENARRKIGNPSIAILTRWAIINGLSPLHLKE